MKIVINTEDNNLLNAFIKSCKDTDNQIIIAKTERVLFDIIEKGNVDAYVISNDILYRNKACTFIKKSDSYTPIIALVDSRIILTTIGASIDICIPYTTEYDILIVSIINNIIMFNKTFATLKKLTTKIHEKIEFANCVYDPTRRILYYKGKEIKKLSVKEGGILEVLAINYGEVVKKEVILEKVWKKPNDYFAGRSCDVYITYLRNTFKNNKVKLSIKNISGIGLILE